MVKGLKCYVPVAKVEFSDISDCYFCKNFFLSSGIPFQCIDVDFICEVSERIIDFSYGNCDKYRFKFHFHCKFKK